MYHPAFNFTKLAEKRKSFLCTSCTSRISRISRSLFTNSFLNYTVYNSFRNKNSSSRSCLICWAAVTIYFELFDRILLPYWVNQFSWFWESYSAVSIKCGHSRVFRCIVHFVLTKKKKENGKISCTITISVDLIFQIKKSNERIKNS
jgi:hypothetical protein